MKLKSIIIAALFIVNTMEVSASSTKKKEKEKSSSRKKTVDGSYEAPDQFVSEEYGRSSFKAERMGPYQVIYMDKKIESVPESEYFHQKGKSEKKEKKKKGKKGEDVKNAHFNNGVESQSDTSSVADEYPRTHPSVTEKNAKFSDVNAGRRTRLMLHIPIQKGGFDMPVLDDKTDVLAANIKPANFYTSHDTEYDGFMTASTKEEDTHLWRNESIHPQRTYVRNNEVDPLVPHYEVDVDTSQKEMESHFGRYVGRDNKKKLFPNRNSFSSVNDGCIMS